MSKPKSFRDMLGEKGIKFREARSVVIEMPPPVVIPEHVKKQQEKQKKEMLELVNGKRCPICKSM